MDEKKIQQLVLESMDWRKYSQMSEHMVVVTYIKNALDFYVRPCSLLGIMPILERRGDPIADLDMPISTLIIYKSKKLKNYVRGNIRKILFKENCPLFTLCAIDYGCVDKGVRTQDMYVPHSAIDVPPLCIQCGLMTIESVAFMVGEDVTIGMKYFTLEPGARMKVLNNANEQRGKLIVELRTLKCPDSVAVVLRHLNLHFIGRLYIAAYRAYAAAQAQDAEDNDSD